MIMNRSAGNLNPFGGRVRYIPPVPRTSPTPTPTPTPTSTPFPKLTQQLAQSFKYGLTPETTFVAHQKIAFKRNFFSDTFYFAESAQTSALLKTMIVSVDGLFRSAVEFSEDRIGSVFGYKPFTTTTSDVLTGRFVDGVADLTKTENYLPPPSPTPAAIQTPVTTIFIDKNNSIVNTSVIDQTYFIIDTTTVSRFTLTINGIDGVTFANNFDACDFNNCHWSIAPNSNISTYSSKLFVSSNVQLSVVDTDIFTFYYFTTGSTVLGISPSSRRLIYDPKAIIIPNPPTPMVFPTPTTSPSVTPTPTSTLPFTPTPTCTPDPTPTITPTPTATTIFDAEVEWNDSVIWNDDQNWKDVSAVALFRSNQQAK